MALAAQPAGVAGRYSGLALLGLTIVALVLRSWGLDRLLPHDVEPDARIPYQIEILRAGDEAAREEAHFGQYPLLFAYLGVVLPRFEAPAVGERASLDEHLEGAAQSVLHARRLIALISTLAVPLTYLLARQFVDVPHALLAALLVATSPSHLWYSQQARPHAAMATLTVLAVLACIGLARGTGWQSWFAAGVAVALAIGSLQSGVALVFPLAVAAVVRARHDGVRRAAPAVLAFAPIAVLVPICYPFLVGALAGNRFDERAAGQLELEGQRLVQAGQPIDLSLFDGDGFGRMLLLLASWEPWLLLGSTIGFAAVAADLLRRRALRFPRAELLVVLAHALPYLVVLGLYSRTVIRFCTPLLPHAAVFCAFGLARLGRRWRPWTLVFTVVVMVFMPLATAIRGCWLGTRPDTQELAADWVESNLDPSRDRLLCFPRAELPLFADAASIEEARAHGMTGTRIHWLDWQADHAAVSISGNRWDLRALPLWNRAQRDAAKNATDAFFEATGANYIVLQGSNKQRMGPLVNRLLGWVRENCELVHVIAPDRRSESTRRPFRYEDLPGGIPRESHVSRLWHAQSLGPVIEIYRRR